MTAKRRPGHVFCADCGHDLARTDPDLLGRCDFCGAYAAKPPPVALPDPRRRHTPEEAARREKHGGTR